MNVYSREESLAIEPKASGKFLRVYKSFIYLTLLIQYFMK